MYILGLILTVILFGVAVWLIWTDIEEKKQKKEIEEWFKSIALKEQNKTKTTRNSTQDEMVKIGSIVTIFDKDLCEECTYKIVDPTRNEKYTNKRRDDENELTYDSALGKALILHSVGDCVTVQAEEKYEVKIISIDNSAITTKANQGNNSRAYLEVMNDGLDPHEYYGMPPDDFDD